MLIFTLFLFLFSLTILVDCQSASQCYNKKKCRECISFAEERCVWCKSNRDNIKTRCLSEIEAKENTTWCDDIYNPGYTETDRADEPVRKTSAGETNAHQVAPQKLKVTMRPGIPYDFEMTYQPDLNYPLDVYYLMDFSYSMESHFKSLKNQGEQIYDGLKKMTNNLRLGFGSFVDKPVFPIVDKSAGHVAYTFKNHCPLTNDSNLFKAGIGKLSKPQGSNYDDPEAILEALMQTMVCKEVNWRNESRKIVVASTDSTYHSAGDGRFLGAIELNDMKCHLSDPDLQLVQDYPSVGQIKMVALQNDFSIIFAVVSTALEEYRTLAEQLECAESTKLEHETNLVELITQKYLDLVQQLKLTPQHTSNVALTLTPDCYKGDSACGIEHNGKITIKGSVKVKSCPTNKKESLKIAVLGLNEALDIDIEVICNCDCEKIPSMEKSPSCTNAGVQQCGICYCDANKYGDKCECDANTTSSSTATDSCKRPGSDEQCSGRGKCECGNCICDHNYYEGDYCEFSKTNCPRFEGLMCYNKGECKNEECQCREGWTGTTCNCPTSNDTCIARYSKKICSGNGECHCGECKCNNTNNKTYMGVFCDLCDECALQRCEDFKEYVICNYMSRNQTVCDVQCNLTADVQFVNTSEINKNYKEYTRCAAYLDDGSTIVFKYDFEKSNDIVKLVIQDEKEEPSKANIIIAVGSTVGIILLIGLLTLIAWKILVDIYDAREYKKFEEQSKAAGFEVYKNPYYKEPAVNFQNPAYSSDL